MKTLGKSQVHKALTFHSMILGASGSGKTELAKAMFHFMPHSAIFINTVRHKLQATELDPGNWATMAFLHTQGRAIKASISPAIHEDFEAFALRVKEYLTFFNIVQEVDHRHPLYLFVDEMKFFESVLPFFRNLTLLGRNYKFWLVSISQRPQLIDKSVFTQSNMIYSHFDEFDHRYLKEMKVKVQDLPKFVFEYYPKVNKEGAPYLFKMQW